MAMRIGIIGAGAIGSVVGGMLTKAGHELDEELFADCSGRLGRAARCSTVLVLFRSACPRVNSAAGEVPLVGVLFRRPVPERGVRASPHPALQ